MSGYSDITMLTLYVNIFKTIKQSLLLEILIVSSNLLQFTPQPKNGCAVNCNSIRLIGSSPLAKSRMPGKPYFLALSRQRVPGQGVNSNDGASG